MSDGAAADLRTGEVTCSENTAVGGRGGGWLVADLVAAPLIAKLTMGPSDGNGFAGGDEWGAAEFELTLRGLLSCAGFCMARYACTVVGGYLFAPRKSCPGRRRSNGD